MEGLHEPGADLKGFTRSAEPQETTVVDTVLDKKDEVVVDQTVKTDVVKTDAIKTEAETKIEAEQKVEVKPIPDEDLFKILNERGIQLKSFDELKSTLSERESLKAEVEKLAKKTIEFPNDKAKELYEFAIKHPGNELSAAKNFLDLVEFDPSKADAKTVQLKAFRLKYPELVDSEAAAIFNEQYEEQYGDGVFEGKALLKFKHDQATKEAQQAIAQVVKNYREAKEPEVQDEGPSKEHLEKVLKGIEGAMKEFKGANISLGEYKTKAGAVVPQGSLSVAMEPEEAAKFKGFLTDPDTFLADTLEKMKGESGLDWNAYANRMFQMVYPEKVYAHIHSQGIEQGQLLMINELKNNQREKTPDATKDAQVPKTWGQSIRESRAQATV